MNSLLRKLRSARAVLKHQGPRYFWHRVRLSIRARVSGKIVILPVQLEDALAVDWTEPAPHLDYPVVVTDRKSRIAWITSPPSPTSGGHTTMFRFISYAEKAGHQCDVYFYNGMGVQEDLEALRGMLDRTPAYPDFKGRLFNYDPKVGVAPDTDAIFATGWETAYPSYRDQSNARRFYFVQDFEPGFYSYGSEAILAENTYHFGFHGITAGGWLSKKLHDDYGMPTDHFDFAVDRTHYHLTNEGERKEIFYYARPVTPRRAFEFGVLALTEFARLKPEYTINLAGWDVGDWDLPFDYVNHGEVGVPQLAEIFNRSAAGLVLSMSNMSLMPLELVACGTIAVVNDAPNNRMVSDNPYLDYVHPAPGAMAKRLVAAVDRPDRIAYSKEMAASLADATWDDSGKQFVTAFERAMRG